ncbi:hypothetical protein [Tenacibaculum ascidiaceicola]|uniref:hypothetical protein n=1 Tax=Tenacibaculum ascidiaceicola TaxID=1699411 RepID=UPI00389417BE
MKTNFKNFAFILLFSIFLFSCQTEESIGDELPLNAVEKLKDEKIISPNEVSSRTTNICDFKITTANNSNLVSIGETKTFTVSDNVPLSTTLSWSVLSGENIDIIGSTNSRSFTVHFNSGFTIGAIRLETNYSGGCNLEFSVYLESPYVPNCNNVITPPFPYPIYSTFGSPVPSNYEKDNLGSNYICTTTINNELSVPYERCASYNWQISPGGNQGKVFPSGNSAIVTVSQPGTYTVTLTTTNVAGSRVEKFILYAEDCDGGIGSGGF